MVRKIIGEIPMLYDIPNDTVLDVTLRMNEEEIDVEVNFNQRIIEENNIIELDEKSLKFVKDNIKDIVGNNHRIIVYYSKDCAVEPWLKEKIENRILSLIRTKVDLLTKGYIGAITPTVLLASVHDRYLCFKYDYVVSYQKTCKLNY
ncbi:MAG: hypothetical protein NZM44_04505 [Candidatus Calescibacterium sp.]|nr:hypothetical protein [Candidatus Calescibacterium sp.]